MEARCQRARESAASSTSPRARSRCSRPTHAGAAPRAATNSPAATRSLRGGRHSARATGLPRGRDRIAPPRRGAARQKGADVRAHGSARTSGVHVKIGRGAAGVGDLAGPWRTGGRRRVAVNDCRGRRLWASRPMRTASPRWRRRWSRRRCPPTPASGVTARASDVYGLRVRQLAEGHRAWRFAHPVASGPEAKLRAHTIRPHATAHASKTRSMKHFVRSGPPRPGPHRRCRPPAPSSCADWAAAKRQSCRWPGTARLASSK